MLATMARPGTRVRPRPSGTVPFRLTHAFGAVSATLAGQAGVGEDELVVPVPDNAGRHVSRDPVVPSGIGPAFPPPRTPELQAAGFPRPPANGAVANRRFASPADLDAASGERRRSPASMPEVIEASPAPPGGRPSPRPARPRIGQPASASPAAGAAAPRVRARVAPGRDLGQPAEV